jgi:hypothetical protein
MERYRNGENQLFQKPPEWWHNVIRENFPGTQNASFQFETFEETSPDGIPFVIQSYTKGCEAEGYSEGIFIQMDIPVSSKNKIHEITFPIISNIRALLRHDLESKLKPGESPLDRDEDPDFAGVVTKISAKTSLALSFYEMQNAKTVGPDVIKFVVSVFPTSKDALKSMVKTKILETYFTNLTVLDRIRALSSPEANDSFKMMIISEDSQVLAKDIYLLETTGGFGESDISVLRNDREIKEIYMNLMKLAEAVENEDQRLRVLYAYDSLEPLLKAGFLDFYIRYYQTKLGLRFS